MAVDVVVFVVVVEVAVGVAVVEAVGVAPAVGVARIALVEVVADEEKLPNSWMVVDVGFQNSSIELK